MIVDVHAHWGPWFFTMDVGDVAVNLATMDTHGIDVQVVSATEAVCYDVAGGNAHLAEVLASAPDPGRLLGYVTCDPRRVDLAERDLGRYLGGPFAGVKVHTSYTRTPVTAPAMRDLFALLDEHDVIALVHTWGDDDVVALAELVASYSRVRVICGHTGADGYRSAVVAAGITDRVWFEPSWSSAPAGRIRWLADNLPADRLLFGTDSTLIDPAVAFGALEAADLDDARRHDVLSANARALFGL